MSFFQTFLLPSTGAGPLPHLVRPGREDLLHRRLHPLVRGRQEGGRAGGGAEGEGDRVLPAVGEEFYWAFSYRGFHFDWPLAYCFSLLISLSSGHPK